MATPTIETRFEILSEAKRKELARLEAPMLRAIQYMKSPEYLQDSLAILKKIDKVVQSGRIDQNEALLIVGRMQQILFDWNESQHIIDQYNSVRKSLNLNATE